MQCSYNPSKWSHEYEKKYEMKNENRQAIAFNLFVCFLFRLPSSFLFVGLSLSLSTYAYILTKEFLFDRPTNQTFKNGHKKNYLNESQESKKWWVFVLVREGTQHEKNKECHCVFFFHFSSSFQQCKWSFMLFNLEMRPALCTHCKYTNTQTHSYW